ncbi:MAG: hypothetical protein IJP67_01325 [Oscillospiraceae bacterium]|nr:hypothetical protein [Oscillospiraceae bacterium]
MNARTPGFLIPKLITLASTAYAIIAMLHWPVGFTYFTQLSNIFAALVSLWKIIRPASLSAGMAKFSAAVSITATMLVFLLVLAPMDPRGIAAAYAQDNCASLCLHFITPVSVIADFLMNGPDGEHSPALAVAPPMAYFAFILALSLFGFRWKGMAAPYPFLNYIAPAGWFGFMPESADYKTLGIGVFYAVIVMLAAFLAIGRALDFLRKTIKCGQK